MFSRSKIIRYIEDKNLSDGGYFFAGVEPSSGADTFYAVKTLKLLGLRPKNPEGIKKFMEQSVALTDIHGLFFTLETFRELGIDTSYYKRYKTILDKEKNRSGGFGTLGETYIEVMSELITTYEAITIAGYLDYQIDKKSLKNFIFSFQNLDHGFGGESKSILSTTFYALSALKKLDLSKEMKMPSYLREKEERMKHPFLEDVFYLIMSLSYFNKKPVDPQKTNDFLFNCWRQDNGGFRRSSVIGISTLEDTYYAVTLLRKLESYGIKVFND